MSIETRHAQCNHCQRRTPHESTTTNHVLHLLATVFLCGMWLPVWLLMAASNDCDGAVCTRCGRRQKGDPSLLYLLLGVIVFFVTCLVFAQPPG